MFRPRFVAVLLMISLPEPVVKSHHSVLCNCAYSSVTACVAVTPFCVSGRTPCALKSVKIAL